MHTRFRLYAVLGAWAVLLATTSVFSAVTNTFVMNEVNTVSGDEFVDKGRSDTALGRVEGNGQNWWEFLVVAGDPGKNTLDVRGWKIDWSYHKLPSIANQPDNLNDYGSGTITFSNDPLWAEVPRGTMLTVSEWQDVWYETNSAGQDPFPGAGGLQRAGGVAGTGNVHGVPYDEMLHTKIGLTPGAAAGPNALFTNTYWNPGTNGGGANGDWKIHVFAGERNPDTSFKYFSFEGSVTTNTMSGPVTHQIGTDEAGLFAINNDLWRYSIKDAQDNLIQGPIGEWDPASWNPETMAFGAGVPGSAQSVGSVEVYRLEAFHQGMNPTQANYLGVGISNYIDGSSSRFGLRNEWSSGAGIQGLDGLRNWLKPGDANLDGTVNAADFVIWRNNNGRSGSWLEGDFNGDTMIDDVDYSLWRANFGFTPSGSGAGGIEGAGVPEPSAIALVALICCLFRPRLRRRNG